MDGAPVMAALRLVPALIVLGGIYAVTNGWRRVRLARESRTWSRIEGEVIAVEVARGQQFDGSHRFEPVGSIEKLAATSVKKGRRPASDGGRGGDKREHVRARARALAATSGE